jgi:3-oxoadipate enol-lactonase
MPEITVNGTKFHILDEGDPSAPALVMSNSLGTTLAMWDPQIGALLPHFRLVRYDSRGHGASAVPPGPYSIETLAEDALAIMDALSIERAHWLGLSKGGMVGQWLMTHAPRRIGRAVLANTAAHMPPPELWNERIRAVREKGMAEIAPAIIDRWFTRRFQTQSAEAVAKIEAMLIETPAEGYAACASAIRDMDQRESLRSIDHDVLVIVGKYDPATPPARGRLIAEAIKGAKLIELEAAHLSNVEAPEAFNKAVIAFLRASGKARAARATARKAAVRPNAKKTTPKKTVRRPAAPKKTLGKKTRTPLAKARSKAAAKPAKSKTATTKRTAAKGRAQKSGAKATIARRRPASR